MLSIQDLEKFKVYIYFEYFNIINLEAVYVSDKLDGEKGLTS